jgi:hypothetical protein
MSGQLGLFGAHVPSLEGVDRIRLAASYGGESIATTSSVKRPHLHDGSLWVYVGGGRAGSSVFRLVPVDEFDGTLTTYGQRTGTAEAAEAARNDPMGFYHGMLVKFGRENYVLCGPEIMLEGCIFSEAWAEERTRIGNTPSDDEDEDGEGELFDGFDDDGRTAIGNQWDDDNDESEDAA